MSEKTFGPFELQKAYKTEPVPSDFAQRRRISAAMQLLAERLIRAEADEATLAGWAAQLEAMVETVGIPVEDIVRLSELIAFVNYQVRVVASLRLMVEAS